MFKIKKNIKSIILTITSLFVFFSFAFSSKLKIVNYEIKNNKIKSNIKIVLLTDLHSCKYGEKQKELINAIDQQNPNIILMAGDIADNKIPHENTRLVLESIGKKYPCFYVTGNHEIWAKDFLDIKTMFRDNNINILEGDTKIVEINEQIINIAGIDDPYIGEDLFYEQLNNCGNNIIKDAFNILLTHRPERINNYLKYDFDLITAGHAHGGQWRIPYLLNGLLAPNQGFFPKYAGGLYKFDKTDFIVSRGLARESTRIPRIFNRPELIVINLKTN
ncbi:MAG: metallophosphoesterase [Peptostreptococcaceae bacterium]|jgi:predicted MPP superfamily phosphohydrolase|nr:metallophosphoesterase [Peptostreptococcaceae bacterium]